LLQLPTSLHSRIEADPVKQETSYDLLKDALLVSYGKTKWQMAYALLDHPARGDRRPSAMMAEMLALRFETSAPDSLFLALFLRRLLDSIRDHLAAANHSMAPEMATHADRNNNFINSCSKRRINKLGNQEFRFGLRCFGFTRHHVNRLHFA
jgi:hypothetical protein